jgi:hypothetical protein
MNPTVQIPALVELRAVLDAQHAVCEELLVLATRESEALESAGPFPEGEFMQARNALLPRLTQTLESVRRSRVAWMALAPGERARYPEAGVWMRRNQELIMRIVVLDRENEQARLRRGLVPANRLPAFLRQRPEAVAQCYRGNQGS